MCVDDKHAWDSWITESICIRKMIKDIPERIIVYYYITYKLVNLVVR